MSTSIADKIVEKLTPIYGDHDFDSLLKLWWQARGYAGEPTNQAWMTLLASEPGGSVSDKLLAYWDSWSAAVGLKLPGTSGNYVSSPDSVLNSITGDIDIRVKVKLTNDADAGKGLVTKWGAAGNRSWVFYQNAGALQFAWSIDGTATTGNKISSNHGFAPGTAFWARVMLDVDNGSGQSVVTFQTSTDGVTWTQLGSPATTTGVTSIFDSTIPLIIGSENLGTTALLNGTYYYAEVRSGINGPVVAKFDTREVVSTGARLPATVSNVFSNLGDQANTTTPWTINGSAWNWDFAQPLILPEMALSLPGISGNYASTPDAAGFDVVGDIDIRAKLTATDWGPSAADQYVLAKWGGGAQRSYYLRLRTNGALQLATSPDGVFNTIPVVDSNALLPFADGATGWVRVTLDVDNGAAGRTVSFFTSTDGLTWTPLGTPVVTAGTTSIFAGTDSLTIGTSLAGVTAFAGTVHYAEVRNGINGPIVAKFDPSAIAKTGTRLPTTLTQPGGSPNLLTPNQASIETDATGWVAGNGAPTLARSTAQFLDGAASLSVTLTALGAFDLGTSPVAVVPVVVGKSYRVIGSVKAAAAVVRTGSRMRINWFTSALAYISSSDATSFTTSTSWQVSTVDAVAPATAAFGVAGFRSSDTGCLIGDVFYLDRVSLVETPTVWTINGSVWDWVDAA